MKQSATIALVALAILVGTNYGTWVYRGHEKDREFASIPHKRDTVTVETFIPQKPVHAEPGAQKPVATPAIDSTAVRIAEAGKDSVVKILSYVLPPIDITIRSRDSASVRLRYDPLTRIPVADFQPAPVRKIETIITDSVRVPPIIEHDSWTTRTAIFVAGAGVAAVLVSLTK